MNDKLNGADTGAHEVELPGEPETQDAQTQDPETQPGLAPTEGTGPSGSASGGRFGIRRGRTRAEERIAELDTSPVRLTAELDAMRARAEAAEAELADAKTGWPVRDIDPCPVWTVPLP